MERSNFITEFIGANFSEDMQKYLGFLIYTAICIVAIIILNWIFKSIFYFILRRANKLRQMNLISYALDNKFPKYIARLLSYFILKIFASVVFIDHPQFLNLLYSFLAIYIVFIIIGIVLCMARIFINILQENENYSNKPMKSYLQVLTIILYIIGAIILLAYFTNQSMSAVIAGLGAISAILILVFQDSIKGFVGSIQITVNNMVELGDWIQIDKHRADGNVEEINLTTVKVRNFDNTITMVPTYSLISDSFQNWSAMGRSGARRMKRSIFIKQTSIKNLTKESIETIKGKLRENNINFNPSIEDVATNNDFFMAFALNYLKNNPNIIQNETCMVRQLAPTSSGLPVEFYAFTTAEWLEHEAICSKIMNYLIGSVNIFQLEIFEAISDTSNTSIAKCL